MINNQLPSVTNVIIAYRCLYYLNICLLNILRNYKCYRNVLCKNVNVSKSDLIESNCIANIVHVFFLLFIAIYELFKNIL